MLFVRLFLLLLPLGGFTQTLLRFPAEILSAKKSHDQQRIALTTKDSVYIVDAAAFRIIRQWKHHQSFPVVVDFHPTNNELLLLQRNMIPPPALPGFSDGDLLRDYLEYQKTWQENPLDSITLWNAKTAELLRTASGSFCFQFGKKEGAYAGVMNKVFSYPYQGKTSYSARSAELVTQDGQLSKTTPFEKAARRLLMDPQEKHLAISWYNGYVNNRSVYSLDIFSFPDQQLRFRIDSLPELVADFCFSPSGEQLAVCAAFTKEKKIRIYEVKTGKWLQEIPVSGKQLQFSEDGALLQYKSADGNWNQWDLRLQKNTQKIWSRLTSLWSLDQYCAIGDQLFFTGPAWSGVPFASEKYFQLEAVRLADLLLFSTVNDPITQLLTDSSSFTLQLNDISEETRLGWPELHFNTDRTLFTSTQENQLQVWNARLRKKILQRNFPRSIKAFPDRSGAHILIIEDNGQESYSEYRMHLLSPQQNTWFSSSPLIASDSVMNGSFGQCNCQPQPQQDKTWICSDGSGTLWTLSGDQLRQQKIVTVKNISISHWETSPNGTSWLIGKNAKEERELWTADLRSGQTAFVHMMNTDRFLADSMGVWTWSSQKDSTLRFWEKGVLRRTLPLRGRIIQLDQYDRQGTVFVQWEKDSEQYWQLITKQGDTLPAQRTKWINARFYPLHADEILAEAGNLHSILSQGALNITWTQSSTRVFRKTNFDVSASGRFLLIGNHVMDLKEVTLTAINKFNPALLLQDSSGLQWVEVFSEVDYSGRKAAFGLQRFSNQGRDTLTTKQWIRGVNVDPFQFIHETMLCSPDNKWLLTLPETGKGKESPPVLWDLQTLEGRPIGTGKENIYASFSSDSKTIRIISYTLSADGMQKKESLEEYSIQPLKKLRQQQRVVPINERIAEGKDQYRINSRNVEWYQPVKEGLQLKRRYFSRDYLEYVAFHEPSGLITAGTYSGSIHFWEREGASSPAVTLNAHNAAIVRMEVRGDRLFTLGGDGSVTITHIPTKKILVRMITLQKEEGISMALYTPEGYYKADPSIATSLHFVKCGEVYPLSSFDYQGNRPDKVYAAMGLSDPGFIELLKQSWEARLKRAGIAVAEKPVIPVFPAVEWDRTGQAALVQDSLFSLSLKIKDEGAGTNTLFIRINGVPVFSRYGKPVPSGPAAAAQSFTIQLNEGRNRISVSALNAKGQESVEQEFEVYYQPPARKTRRVFYAGVGVSTYKDAAYTLRYAAKDVEDIAEKIKPFFDSVYTLTLTNEKASRLNILQLHEWLKQTGTDDIVILSLSGHGLIQTGKGFFFAPHEMDFNDPAQTGVSMNDLESLLDDIPARRRLLLLDACHSGEEWYDTITQNQLPAGVTITRGGKIGKGKASEAAPKRQSFLLMKELFSDLSRGNGAFMISAAGSTEFAYEGKEWKNGVFSRSFLESLRELRYRDSFKGAQPIPVSELRKRIYEKVSTLTRGQQNPVSRQENGWWDWEL